MGTWFEFFKQNAYFFIKNIRIVEFFKTPFSHLSNNARIVRGIDQAPLHERMPWILSPEEQKSWLTPNQWSAEALEHLLQRPHDELPLECFPVTPAVNSALYKENDTTQPIVINP